MDYHLDMFLNVGGRSLEECRVLNGQTTVCRVWVTEDSESVVFELFHAACDSGEFLSAFIASAQARSFSCITIEFDARGSCLKVLLSDTCLLSTELVLSETAFVFMITLTSRPISRASLAKREICSFSPSKALSTKSMSSSKSWSQMVVLWSCFLERVSSLWYVTKPCSPCFVCWCSLALQCT